MDIRKQPGNKDEIEIVLDRTDVGLLNGHHKCCGGSLSFEGHSVFVVVDNVDNTDEAVMPVASLIADGMLRVTLAGATLPVTIAPENITVAEGIPDGSVVKHIKNLGRVTISAELSGRPDHRRRRYVPRLSRPE